MRHRLVLQSQMLRNYSPPVIVLFALTSRQPLCPCVHPSKPNCVTLKSQGNSTKYCFPLLCDNVKISSRASLTHTPRADDIFLFFKIVSILRSKVDVGTTFSKDCPLLKTRNQNKILRLLFSFDLFTFIEISPSLFLL